MTEASLLLTLVVCALVSAKWSLDLGYGGGSQFLHAIGGLIFGPLGLLVLYARMAQKKVAEAGR